MCKKQRFEHHLEGVKGSEVRAGPMENPQGFGLQLVPDPHSVLHMLHSGKLT